MKQYCVSFIKLIYSNNAQVEKENCSKTSAGNPLVSLDKFSCAGYHDLERTPYLLGK